MSEARAGWLPSASPGGLPERSDGDAKTPRFLHPDVWGRGAVFAART